MVARVRVSVRNRLSSVAQISGDPMTTERRKSAISLSSSQTPQPHQQDHGHD